MKFKTILLLGLGLLFFLACHIYSTNGKGIRDSISLEYLLFGCVFILTLFQHARLRSRQIMEYKFSLIVLFTSLFFCVLTIGFNVFPVVFFVILCLLLLSNIRLSINDYSVLCIALVLEITTYYLFYGIGDENGIAINLSCGLVGLLCLVFNHLDIKNRWSPFIILLWMSGSIYLLFLTQCRGGIFAIILVGIFSLFTRTSKTLKGTKKTIRNTAILILFYIIYTYLITIPEVELLFFEKWDSSDLSSNRLEIWQYVLNNTPLFGRGPDYLKDMDAHNSYIDFLGTFGWISIFVLLIVIIVYIKRNRTLDNLPVPSKLFLVYWATLSMTENLNPFTSRFSLVSLFLFINISYYLNLIGFRSIVNDLKIN